jgi:hypothetical protein
MSESGDEKPKDPRKNIFSFVDKFAQRKSEEQKRRDALSVPSDLIDYSVFDDPDKVRRKSIVIKAGQMLDALRADPVLSPDAIAEERKKLPQDIQSISDFIEKSTHQQLIREPNRFWAILDIFFEPLDKLTETVIDQNSAEEDIMSRFKPKRLTKEEWIHALATQESSLPPEERQSFQDMYSRNVDMVRIMQTPNIVQLLDEYARGEWGPGAPYLLALLHGYKKRRTLSEKGE